LAIMRVHSKTWPLTATILLFVTACVTRVPPLATCEEALRAYASLRFQKAIALARDSSGRCVSGYSWGFSTASAATNRALAECRKQALKVDIYEECRLTLVGNNTPQGVPSIASPRAPEPPPLQHRPTERAQQTEPQQAEKQQTGDPAYRPCIQGPETLRFFDKLWVSADKEHIITFQGDELWQFIDRLPPLTRQRFTRIFKESMAEAKLQMLARPGQDIEITPNYRASFFEDAPEEYIADCSDLLARLSAVAAMPDMWIAESVARLWQANLEFMKWWLENYRQKIRLLRNKAN